MKMAKKKPQLKSMLHLKANLINLWVQWTKIVLKTSCSALLLHLNDETSFYSSQTIFLSFHIWL